MLFNKRKRKQLIGIGVCLLVLLVVSMLVPHWPSGNIAPVKEEESPVDEQRTAKNVPFRKPPPNIKRRELPPLPSLSESTNQQAIAVLPPEAGNLNPQWTKPLAMPVKDPIPPDPYTPPPMKVDPTRRPEPDVPRQTIN